MTTILKAAQQLDSSGRPAVIQAPASQANRYRWLLVAACGSMLLGLAGGALTLVLFLSRHEASESGPRRAPEMRPRAAVAPQPAAAALQPQTSATESPPWVHVEKGKPASPPIAARPGPRLPDSEAKERSAGMLPPIGDAAADVPALQGAPGLQVQSIVYASDPVERQVTLRLAGAGAVTLREGESAGGVEVQLILPKLVYLRRDGSVFAVKAAR